jgi:hypothetical protein
MKASVFIAICCAAMALSCASARAQDRNRVQDANQEASSVDSSVRADVAERLKQVQPYQKPSKSPVNYSRWAFQSANQAPATRFWPTQVTTPSPGATADGKNRSTLSSTSFHPGMQPSASTVWPDRAPDSKITPITDGHSGKLDRQPVLFGGLSVGRQRYVSTALQLLKTTVPPLSSRHRVGGFSTQFREKKFGLTNGFSFPTPFPKTTFSSSQDPVQAKQNKRHPQKSADRTHAAPSLDSPAIKQN